MNCDLKYLCQDINRLVLLLRSCEDVEKRQKWLDDLNNITEAIGKLYSEEEQ